MSIADEQGQKLRMQLVLDKATPYTRIVAGLISTIAKCKVGDRLPSERELSQQFSVSRPTVRKALEALSQQEILEVRHGAGTFVRKPVPQESGPVNRTRLIGLSVPTLDVPHVARFVGSAEREIGEAGYRTLLLHDHGDPQMQASDIAHLLDGEVEGLLIFLDRDNVVRPEYLQLLKDIRDLNRPVMLVDRYVPGLDLPCVLTDTVRAMYEATEHLILLGRRRLAVLSWGPAAGIAEQNRFTGFRNAMRDYGLPAEPVLHAELGYGDAPEVTARKAVARWVGSVAGDLPFDAIVCFLDNMAYGAFLALKDAGVSIPGDVALIGVDNINAEAYRAMGLELTSVEQPFAEIGKVSVQRLLGMIQGDRSEGGPKHVLLPPRLIVRSSCGEALAG